MVRNNGVHLAEYLWREVIIGRNGLQLRVIICPSLVLLSYLRVDIPEMLRELQVAGEVALDEIVIRSHNVVV